MKTDSSRGRHLGEPRTEAQKRAFRLETVSRLASLAAHHCSVEMQTRSPGTADRVLFRKDAAPKMMARYWDLVAWFKKDQQFQQGVRVNSPKKAALTAYAAITADPPLFEVSEGADKTHKHAALTAFCRGLMDAFMDVKDKALADRHLRDLWVVIENMSVVSPDAGLSEDERRVRLLALCLYMDTYWSNLGKNDAVTTDD